MREREKKEKGGEAEVLRKVSVVLLKSWLVGGTFCNMHMVFSLFSSVFSFFLYNVATGGSWGFFCSAPQDFEMLGVFCARFPPREASIHLNS